jgi:hypothetical protein
MIVVMPRDGARHLLFLRSWLQSWFAHLLLWRRQLLWLMNIRSMRRRSCMRHLMCTRHLMYMRTPVRFGVTDGAINVTFAAVGRAGAP